MTPEQFREIDSRFHEALDLPEAERALLLERLCARDPLVGQKVRAMLAADQQVRHYMEAPAVQAAPQSLLRQLAESPGDIEPIPAEPRRIGPYLLQQQLGRGGMGVVYRAQHQETGRRVALKTVVESGEGLLSSIRREIRALARLHHPGIVGILDEGVDQGRPWYAMELLEGTPLNRYWQHRISSAPAAPLQEPPWWTQSLGEVASSRQGTSESPAESVFRQARGDQRAAERACQPASREEIPVFPEARPGSRIASPASEQPQTEPALPPGALPPAAGGLLPEALQLVRQLCSALAYLHGEGLVHRDLKPANILMRSEERSHSSLPVLIDFGLMTQFTASEVSREVFDIAALAAGTVLYMAPEQARGELVDARADLYALGCILYQLVCGQPPFAGTHPIQILSQHFSAQPKPLSQRVDGVPEALDALILKLLAKDPRQRLGYATDVAATLLQIEAQLSAPQPQPREVGEDLPKARSYLYRPGFGGRQIELELLHQRLNQLKAAEAGARVLLIGGESGIGKTRLAMEFARTATESKVRVLVGECLPASQQAGAGALQALRRPLQQIADRCRERGIEETQRVLGARGKVLQAYEPALDGLPGQEAHPTPAQLPPAGTLQRLYAALTDTFVAVAQSQPLLLVLDDLQWADELTLGFVQFFLHQTPSRSQNVLLLATYRTEEVSPALRKLCDDPQTARIQLHRFDETTVAHLIADMLALHAPPPLFSRHLARQSEGNAFFVAEYLRAAVGEGLLWRDPQGVWQVADPTFALQPNSRENASLEAVEERLPLPASLRQLVGRRLDGLSAAANQVVQAAAVLGRQVQEALLVPLADLESNAVLDAIGELVTRQILEPGDRGLLRFVHDKIREVAYQRIQAQTRPTLHRAAAVALEARPEKKADLAALGHHWEQAGETQLARQSYLAGAQVARNDAALGEAERLYRACVRLATQPDEDSAQALNALGLNVLHPQGRNEEAQEAFETALQIARAAGLRKQEGESLARLGIIHWLTRNLAQAADFLEESLRIRREQGDWAGVSNSLDLLATVKSQQGSQDEALALYEEALVLAIQSGALKAQGITLCNLAMLKTTRCRWTEAHAHYQQALELFRTLGDKRLESSALENSANLLRLLGHPGESIAALHQAIALQQEIGDRRNEAYSMCHLADAYEAQGRPDEARALYQKALEFGRRASELRVCMLTLHGLSHLDLTEGALEDVQRHLDEALSHAHTLGLQEAQAEGLLRFVRLNRLGYGQLAKAESLLQEAMDLLQNTTITEYKIHICCEQGHGLIAKGRSAEVPLQQAIGLVQGMNASPGNVLDLQVGFLKRAQAAFEANQHHRLLRGELLDDLPEKLRQRLTRSASSPSEPDKLTQSASHPSEPE